MRVSFVVRKWIGVAALTAVSLEAALGAQAPGPTLSAADALRLAFERNQTLRAQRLGIDESRADEITAALKPNINFSFSAGGLSLFSPRSLTFSTASSLVTYDAGLSYTFERGGKRSKRTLVAADTTDVTTRNVRDAERQLRFQVSQAFINVLLSKALLDVARQNLDNFSREVDLNQERVRAGDLSEGDFLPISIQKLQFETDVSSAELGMIQAKASLRQLVGFEAVPEEYDVSGELTSGAATLNLDDLKKDALASRPDLQAAESGLKLAEDTATLERANRARDVAGSVDYTKATASNTVVVGVSFDLPFHDRNQGNIAHADIAVKQAQETQAAMRAQVLTDVTSSFAAYQTSVRIVKYYESGYLDQARRSLEITTYAFQQGATTLANLLDAERTNRDTQLTYRQALATLMTNAQQLNLAVGKQVIP
jgi:cobalt-zinc-cadmium efflux system outer membrane protein